MVASAAMAKFAGLDRRESMSGVLDVDAGAGGGGCAAEATWLAREREGELERRSRARRVGWRGGPRW